MFRSQDLVKAAVCLNNMAVSLLARTCFQQAFEILRSAVELMQLAGRSTESGQDIEVFHRQQELLTAAYKMMAAPVTSGVDSLLNIKLVSDDVYQYVEFHITALDVDSMRHNRPLITLINLVRIEYSQYENIESDFDMQALIMLSNFGSAQVCQAYVSTHSPTQEALKSSAVKIFNLACSILNQYKVKYEYRQVDNERLVLMGTIILHNITSLSHSMKGGFMTTSLIDKLKCLVIQNDDFFSFLQIMGPVTRAASAA